MMLIGLLLFLGTLGFSMIFVLVVRFISVDTSPKFDTKADLELKNCFRVRFRALIIFS